MRIFRICVLAIMLLFLFEQPADAGPVRNLVTKIRERLKPKASSPAARPTIRQPAGGCSGGKCLG